MAIKHIITNGQGDAVNNPSIKSKAKPKKFVQKQSITDYILERDRVLYRIADEETKQALKEKYGK